MSSRAVARSGTERDFRAAGRRISFCSLVPFALSLHRALSLSLSLSLSLTGLLYLLYFGLRFISRRRAPRPTLLSPLPKHRNRRGIKNFRLLLIRIWLAAGLGDEIGGSMSRTVDIPYIRRF